MKEFNPIPGQHEITNPQYHSGPGVSNSDLKYIRKAPIHYWAKKLSEEGLKDSSTRAKSLGTAVHAALLEPELFEKNYRIIPEDAPRKPSDRQWNAKNPSPDSVYAMEWWTQFNIETDSKVLITNDDWNRCIKIRETVLRHPVAGRLFADGLAEQSFYAEDEETGLLLKCRPDWICENGIMVDLKKVTDCSKTGFGRAAANYDYYVQAPFYNDVLERLYGESPSIFIFVAVEEDFPYDLNVVYETAEQMQRGRLIYQQDLRKVAECTEKNEWPGACTSVEPLWLPGWV